MVFAMLNRSTGVWHKYNMTNTPIPLAHKKHYPRAARIEPHYEELFVVWFIGSYDAALRILARLVVFRVYHR